MARLNVVFDTNVYRQLSDTRFEELRALEVAKQVLPFASYWTMFELLACTAPPESRQPAAEMSECLPTPRAECATLCAHPGGRPPCLSPRSAAT